MHHSALGVRILAPIARPAPVTVALETWAWVSGSDWFYPFLLVFRVSGGVFHWLRVPVSEAGVFPLGCALAAIGWSSAHLAWCMVFGCI